MSPRYKKSDEQIRLEAETRKRAIRKKHVDLAFRNCGEFCLSVYLVGFLPLIMHASVQAFLPPTSDGKWIPAEAWLFVMVTCAAAFGDSWRERRRDDGTRTFVVAIFGGAGTIFAALAYALITLTPPKAAPLEARLELAVWWAVGIVAILYLLIRWPGLSRDALDEAEAKVAESAKGSQKKGSKV